MRVRVAACLGEIVQHTETREGEDVDEGRRPRRWIVVGAVLLAIATALVVWLLLRGDDAPQGGIAPAADATDELAAEEPLGATAGVTLTGARITREIDPATGRPGDAVARFAPGDTVRFWLAFDDDEVDAGRQTLFVTFTRDGDEVFRTGFRLPQPTGQQNVTLGEAQTQEPGTYTVTVSVDEDVLYETDFEVG